MTKRDDDHPTARGMRRNLATYGDPGFSLFLRKAFIKAAGFSDDALDRPIVGITNTFSDFNPCHGNVPRLIEAVIVTPIRIAVLFIFVGTAYSFVIKRTWEKWRMARIQAKLTDHIVVLGFGVSGGEAVHELIARGTDPACIVVIDSPPGNTAADGCDCTTFHSGSCASSFSGRPCQDP